MTILPIDLDRCIDAINNNANVVRKLSTCIGELADGLKLIAAHVDKQNAAILALRDAMYPRSEAPAAEQPKPRNGKTRMRQKKRNARAGAAP